MPPVVIILTEVRLNQSDWRFYALDNPDFQVGRSTPPGYRVLSICGGAWPEHRLIWKIITGQEPVGLIDHINGVRDDNRFENLRDVTPSQNRINRRMGYWAAIDAERKAAAKVRRRIEREERAKRREGRERALLAKLKAKYEQ